jgi:zinc D-Ala-D-Ala carboxypeptidase
VARIRDGVDINPQPQPGNSFGAVRAASLSLRVIKQGAATGRTTGTIDGLAEDIVVTYNNQFADRAVLTGQMFIAGDGGPFSAEGDSGAMVCTEDQPGVGEITALQALCVNVLQPLRDQLGLPVTISSGFRSPALNRAVGGAPDSQHLTGQAADLQCFSLTTAEFFKRVLALNLPFDQLIYEGGREATWVHVSYNTAGARGEILRATLPPSGGVEYAHLTRDQTSVLVA